MAARSLFGFSELRPGQEPAIASAVGGRDTLAVLPTGAGKSAVYQLAGHLRPGPTVVVSPLLALQFGQVEAMGGSPLAAAQYNSTQSAGERAEVLERLDAGELEFLLLAPEQLASDDLVARLAAARVSLFAVDEAHCVSAWGHDFRPDYLRLGEVNDALGHPPVLALTATAAPPVRAEIVERLHMRDPAVVVAGFRHEGEDKIVVLFNDVGYRTLSIALVVEGRLLETA